MRSDVVSPEELSRILPYSALVAWGHQLLRMTLHAIEQATCSTGATGETPGNSSTHIYANCGMIAVHQHFHRTARRNAREDVLQLAVLNDARAPGNRIHNGIPYGDVSVS